MWIELQITTDTGVYVKPGLEKIKFKFILNNDLEIIIDLEK